MNFKKFGALRLEVGGYRWELVASDGHVAVSDRNMALECAWSPLRAYMHADDLLRAARWLGNNEVAEMFQYLAEDMARESFKGHNFVVADLDLAEYVELGPEGMVEHALICLAYEAEQIGNVLIACDCYEELAMRLCEWPQCQYFECEEARLEVYSSAEGAYRLLWRDGSVERNQNFDSAVEEFLGACGEERLRWFAVNGGCIRYAAAKMVSQIE